MTPQPAEEWHLPTRHLGRRVLVFDALPSTNTLAATLSAPENDGLVLLAREQTAGRGQYGRSWACPKDTGVLLSVILHPSPALRRPVVLAAWAAVAVCQTIQQTVSLPARIKWPNDVLLRGRKVCGILIEQARATIVGLGLNVAQSAVDFERAQLPQAGSLLSVTGTQLKTADVARNLLTQLDEEYARLLDGDLATLQACWQWHLGLLGKQVAVETASGFLEGRLLDAQFDGLEIVTATGPERIQPEMVRHVYASST